jgi:predicted PurR-regulated permease PerM
VIEPAVFGVFVVVLAWPFQRTLQKRIGKAAALALTVAGASAVVLSLVSVIVWSASAVAQWLRENVDLIQGSFSVLTSFLEDHDISLLALLSDQFAGPALIPRLQAVALRANAVLAFSLIVVVYVILGLAEADLFVQRIAALPNRETSRKLLASGETIKRKFRSYMFVRSVASVATGLATWGLAHVIGVELAAAWGVLTFALNYLPYIGTLVIVVVPPIFAFIQFGAIGAPAAFFLGLMVANFVIGSLLEPTFSGATLSIAPPLVLFTIILWTYIWGAAGAFLGVPLAIALISVLEQFELSKGLAALLSGGPPRAVPAQEAERVG